MPLLVILADVRPDTPVTSVPYAVIGVIVAAAVAFAGYRMLRRR